MTGGRIVITAVAGNLVELPLGLVLTLIKLSLKASQCCCLRRRGVGLQPSREIRGRGLADQSMPSLVV